MEEQLGAWYDPSTWLNDSTKELDPNKMSSSELRKESLRGLKPFWETLVTYGFQDSFDELIAYIDELHPTWRIYYGKQILWGEKSLGTKRVYDFARQVAHQSKGKIFVDPKDLQIFGDVLSGELSQPGLQTVGRWFAQGTVEGLKEFGKLAANWMPKLLLVGGLIAGAIILTQIKPIIKMLKAK